MKKNKIKCMSCGKIKDRVYFGAKRMTFESDGDLEPIYFYFCRKCDTKKDEKKYE